MRRGVVDRKTTETQIAMTLGIDGTGKYQVSTGIRFFDHMLELFTNNSLGRQAQAVAIEPKRSAQIINAKGYDCNSWFHDMPLPGKS